MERVKGAWLDEQQEPHMMGSLPPGIAEKQLEPRGSGWSPKQTFTRRQRTFPPRRSHQRLKCLWCSEKVHVITRPEDRGQ